MSNISASQSGRIYLATQTPANLLVASTFTGSNCCRHTKINIKTTNPRYPRNDKTGTLSRTPGAGGRRTCNVDITMDVAANGSPGVAPDCDPILQSLFGGAGTPVASTSYTYNIYDQGQVPVTVGHYRLPSTMRQQIAFGVNFSTMKMSFNEDKVSSVQFTGSGVWAPDSMQFATLDTVGKGGISSFPAEPSSPTTNGPPAAAFLGSLTLDGNSIVRLKSASLTYSRPWQAVFPYGGYYATLFAPGPRRVGLSFEVYDDDSTTMTDLVAHGIEDNVLGAVLVNGNVAGNTWTHTLSGLQLDMPDLDDSSGGNLWTAKWDEAQASVSSISATNEYVLAIT